MQRSIIVLLFLCIVAACHEQKKEANDRAIQRRAKYQKLISLYKEISLDTLVVYSDANAISSDTFRYKGILIDTALLPLLTPKYFEPTYYACFQFPIDSNRTGLITRTPSEYVPSSIKLFIYDKQKNTIRESIELAESWGDAGDSMEKYAWLFKNKNHQLHCFIQQVNTHYNQVDNEKDTTTTIDNLYYLVDLSKKKSDTLTEHADALAAKFRL